MLDLLLEGLFQPTALSVWFQNSSTDCLTYASHEYLPTNNDYFDSVLVQSHKTLICNDDRFFD